MRKITFRRFPKIECSICGGVFRPSYKDLFPLMGISPYKLVKTHCYCPYCDQMHEVLTL